MILFMIIAPSYEYTMATRTSNQMAASMTNSRLIGAKVANDEDDADIHSFHDHKSCQLNGWLVSWFVLVGPSVPRQDFQPPKVTKP